VNESQPSAAVNVLGTSFAPPFPRLGLIAISGDQNYTVTGVTDAFARYDLVILGGNYEGWSSVTWGTHENLTLAIKNGNGNGRPVAPQGTKVLYYQRALTGFASSPLVGSSITPSGSDPKPTYTRGVALSNWWAYQVGPTTSPAYGINLNQGSGLSTDAFGEAPMLLMADPANGRPFGGLNAQGESLAEWAANYSYHYLHTTDRTDARFAAIPTRVVSASCDGMFMDLVLRHPQNSLGDVIDGNRTGSSSASGYDTAMSDWLSAGYAKLFAKYQALTGGSKINFGNAGDYGIANGAGVAPYSMDQVLHGALFEELFGVSFSVDTFSSVALMRTYVSRLYARLQSPQLLLIGVMIPTTGTNPPVATQAQWARYTLAFSCLYNALVGINLNGNGYDCSTSLAKILTYDEFDNAGAQRGYLGQPVGGATGILGGYLIGSGVYAREFAGGLVLWNPKGNGIQTLTAATLGGAGKWRHISGTGVNDGSTVNTSVTLGNGSMDRDGLVLLRI
jgi:hypothetical protein